MKKGSLISLTPRGLYCAEGDFYVDPWLPVDKAVITHAHADHAYRGNGSYLVAKRGASLARIRLDDGAKIASLDYGKRKSINGVKVSFHPAGHILGSAQVRIEYKGEVWVVSGDYKLTPDATSEPFESVRCHHFVTEATFGLPIYRWTKPEQVFGEISDWWRGNRDKGKASVIFAYSLGKAQRVLNGVDRSIGPIFTHGAVERLTQAYREAGIDLPATMYFSRTGTRTLPPALPTAKTFEEHALDHPNNADRSVRVPKEDMRNDRTINNIFDLGAGRYPHLKFTREDFPRVLATRRIEDDDTAEYLGAFLSKTAVRIMIDFLSKTFRLRSCDLDIDGSFPVPCTQYYHKRCLAPCVKRLCGREEYLEMAALARLFVANQRGLFKSALKRRIDVCSEKLDFERAAFHRDILIAVEKYWANKRWAVWLDDAVDTFAVEDTPGGFSVFLVTHRDRSVLGRKVFSVDREEAESSDLVLAEILEAFYQFHLPSEIRVSRDFVGRRELIARLTEKFGRPARIIVVNPHTKGLNAARGLHLTHDEHEFDKAKPLATPDIITRRLAKMFGLAAPPRRVECFDAAHISGTGFVAASAVWQDGHFLSHDYTFLISEEKSELAVLADGVRSRLAGDPTKFPDLIMLDGGKPQMNAVIKSLADHPAHPPVIAAVKPPAKHSSIASFLSPDNPPIAFDVDSPTHAMLQLLRDAAHDLANRTHRDYREMMPFYELLGDYQPLIVPLRLHAENGGADDMIPISVR